MAQSGFAAARSLQFRPRVRYQLSKPKVAQPVDAVGRAALHPLDLDYLNRAELEQNEPTTADLEQLVAGERTASLVGGRYQVIRLLGRGGMASVYAAYDTALARTVALKVLSEDYCGHPNILARFLREARLNARLHHPNIVEVLDFGASRSGVIFLVMELLEGEDLRRTLVRRQTLAWPRARDLMLQICAGLHAAHEAGIVHRDLKPSNCFRVVDGQRETGQRETICLVDFGIATSIDEAASERLTLANHIIGTPEYMSPEQARGEQVDHRSDIYAAGLILGEMLTGALPFRAASGPAMLAAHIYETPPRLAALAPRGARIPAALEAIYACALNKDPSARYPDINAFAAALRGIDAGGPILVSGAYETCPVAPVLETDTELETDTDTDTELEHEQTAVGELIKRVVDNHWLPYIGAASIAFVVGALGALAVATSSSSTPATRSPQAGPAPSGAPASAAPGAGFQRVVVEARERVGAD